MTLARRFYQLLAYTGLAFVLGVMGIGVCLLIMLITYYTLLSFC